MFKVGDVPSIVFKSFYFITKANGLLPFSISFDPLVAHNSFIDQIYTVAYSLTLIFYLPSIQYYIIDFIRILHNPKKTIIFVFLAQVIVSSLRVMTIYSSQAFNHKKIANFVNNSVKLYDKCMKNNKKGRFLDLKLSKWCLSKLVSMFLQIILILVPSFGFVTIIQSSENFVKLLFCFFVILYTHMVLILATGLYFTGMIVIGQFYRNLNTRILKLQKNLKLFDTNFEQYFVKVQRFCNLSDELDQLTCLYSDITDHSRSFNKHQKYFLIFSLLEYFVIILAEMFDAYTRIMRQLSVNKNSTFTQLLKEIGFILFYVIELYYTIKVSSFVRNEARKASVILSQCYRTYFDVRLHRSIELLSLQTLLQAPTTTVCGLFEIDNALLFGMAATFVSYLIILVQFELNDK